MDAERVQRLMRRDGGRRSVRQVVTATILLLGLAAGRVAAQTVAGSVAEPGRWLVTLEDSQGRAVASRVSAEDGSFVLRALRAGAWAVRAERVGFRTTRSDAVELAAGDTTQVTLDATPDGNLAALTGMESSSCVVRPTPDTPTGRAWQQARVALAVAAGLLDQEAILLDASVYRRELAADGRTVRREEPVDVRTGVTRVTPAVDPADLVERGFVREAEDGGFRFFSPAPGVILSDAFQDTHCFRLRPDGGPALVGLAFEPTPGRDSIPDVGGVLWIEAASGRLVLMEYAFRNFELGIPLGGAGGRTVFAELSDGSWVMPETWLRMPLLEVALGEDDAPTQRWGLGGVREEGVRLQRVRSGNQAWSLETSTGTVEGVVRLHEDGEPLEGARVVIPGTTHETRTDAQGRYRLDGLLGGVYPVTARHPRLEALAVGAGVHPVAVQEGSVSHLDLAAPRPEEAAAQLCGGVGTTGPRIILSGQVLDSLTDEPLAGVPLTLRFRDERRDGSPSREVRISSGSGGEYVYCDVPPATEVRIRPQTPGSDGTDDDVFVTANSGVMRRNLVVRLSTETGPSGIFGTVREYSTNRPLENADVVVQGTDIHVLTNSNGFFAIPAVPPGLQVLEVSHLGNQSRNAVVQVGGSGATRVEVELATEAIPVEGITVTVVPRRLFGDMVDMQKRMELGFGTYIMKEELEQRGGNLATALRGKGGVRLVRMTDRPGGLAPVLRGTMDLTGSKDDRGEVWCYPAVYLDGQRWSLPREGGVGHEPLDFTQFLAMDVEAVEVYKGAGSVPGEFGGGDAACGAIVIWSRRGGVTIRGKASGRGGSDGGGS